MKILVIGSKGFIGSHVQQYLHVQGYEVWGADVVVDYTADRYLLIDASNEQFKGLFGAHQFDACINCGGAASVAASVTQPQRDYYLNVKLVFDVLEAIRTEKPTCKFIQLSSAAVYGNPTTLPIAENAAAQPISPYGWHKYQSELLCKEFAQLYQVPTIALRIFSAYGPGLKKQLLWDWFQKARLHDTVAVFGSGEESRDFIYITDLVAVIALALQKAAFDGSTVNVANGTAWYIKDAAALFFGYLQQPYHFMGTTQAGDPINWQASIHTIQQWGYQPQVSIPQGFQQYIAWAKEFR
ncbi:NAD-dependent epimerase/dehydratase family protein [Ferruginibacter yonginensis]|uniref:NAD-dependent epimerase/dehydratase family protein n=1 Tax=Ferruginibacter yonginensis TaxID=1310416 RepID=A0ABV8QNF5_9BACT